MRRLTGQTLHGPSPTLNKKRGAVESHRDGYPLPDSTGKKAIPFHVATREASKNLLNISFWQESSLATASWRDVVPRTRRIFSNQGPVKVKPGAS